MQVNSTIKSSGIVTSNINRTSVDTLPKEPKDSYTGTAINEDTSSDMGKNLAKLGLTMAGKSNRWDDSLIILGKTFKSISDSPNTTKAEKMIANEIAIPLIKSNFARFDINDVGKATMKMMEYLAAPTSGPLAQVIAKVCYDSANQDFGAKNVGRAILNRGFDIIKEQKGTTFFDQFIAETGQAVNDNPNHEVFLGDLLLGNSEKEHQKAVNEMLPIMKQIKDMEI